MKYLKTLFVILAAFAALPAQDVQRTQDWPQDVLHAMARVPVQDGGRVKPLDTFAQFHLLAMNGKRTLKRELPGDEEEKLAAIAWLLDCLFYPEQAWDYETIVVDDARVVEGVGLSADGKDRRDRYSMRELEPGFTRLGELGQQYSRKSNKIRNGLENQTLRLAGLVPQLRRLLGFLDFTRETYDLAEVPALKPLFPGKETVTFMEVVRNFEKVREAFRGQGHDADPKLSEMMNSIGMTVEFAGFVNFLPPTDREIEEWDSPQTVLMGLLRGERTDPEQVELVEKLAAAAALRADMAKLGPALIELSETIRARAKARGEGLKVDAEVAFYKRDWFYMATIVFLFSFLVGLSMWAMPFWKQAKAMGRDLPFKVLYWSGFSLLSLGTVLTVLGIILRCYIRERPPVTTTYEAVLFITGTSVLVLAVVERIYRNGLWIAVAAAVGALGMQLGAWQETAEAVDTMQPLQAVLDTNFWLSTHVTMVTLGYGGAFIAGFIGHIYVGCKFLQIFGLLEKSKLPHHLSRTIYGVMCFGLVFALGGTILGGVWANDSWGRFWGWDPKENGALMLCLVFLAVVHARMGGYIREFGIALSAILANITMFWAFWGVNLLQIGLHSYGFDEKKAKAWQLVYTIEGCVVLFGMLVWAVLRFRARSVAG